MRDSGGSSSMMPEPVVAKYSRIVVLRSPRKVWSKKLLYATSLRFFAANTLQRHVSISLVHTRRSWQRNHILKAEYKHAFHAHFRAQKQIPKRKFLTKFVLNRILCMLFYDHTFVQMKPRKAKETIWWIKSLKYTPTSIHVQLSRSMSWFLLLIRLRVTLLNLVLTNAEGKCDKVRCHLAKSYQCYIVQIAHNTSPYFLKSSKTKTRAQISIKTALRHDEL